MTHSSAKPNYVGRLLLLGVLMASARCDCNQNGDPRIHPDDVPLALGWMTCILLDCCEHHVVEDQCMMLISQAETWVARTHELGLDYDGDCALKLYYYGEGPYECSVFEQNEHYWACDQVCALYYGSAALGEPCELVGLHMSTCTKDLVCGPDERCHAPCDAPELALVGQRCGAALGLPCAMGLACAASGRCVDVMPLGSACDFEQPCDVDAWCGASSLCEARVEDGQACEVHEQCLSQLCEAGGCVAPTLPYCVNPVL